MFGFGFFGLNVVTKSPKLMYCFFFFLLYIGLMESI